MKNMNKQSTQPYFGTIGALCGPVSVTLSNIRHHNVIMFMKDKHFVFVFMLMQIHFVHWPEGNKTLKPFLGKRLEKNILFLENVYTYTNTAAGRIRFVDPRSVNMQFISG